MLPRGHSSADLEFQTYFRAFTYLTKLAPKGAPVAALQDLPPALRAAAARWVSPYRAFIAPSRAPLVWGDSGTLPAYARHPADRAALFPLSWGFDNEVLLATVFHPDWPAAEQITGPAGARILPSALDLADDPRPYVYAISPQGLVPRWRGSALAWPLLDTALAPDDSGVLCALHRGDSFLEPDPATTRTRVAAYRWNGFGFSGWDAAAALARCRELWIETPKGPGAPVIPGGDPSDG